MNLVLQLVNCADLMADYSCTGNRRCGELGEKYRDGHADDHHSSGVRAQSPGSAHVLMSGRTLMLQNGQKQRIFLQMMVKLGHLRHLCLIYSSKELLEQLFISDLFHFYFLFYIILICLHNKNIVLKLLSWNFLYHILPPKVPLYRFAALLLTLYQLF